MIKNKLESLKGGKFTAFKKSGLGLDNTVSPPMLAGTRTKDGKFYDKDAFFHGDSECYNGDFNGGTGPGGDLYYWDDLNQGWRRTGRLC